MLTCEIGSTTAKARRKMAAWMFRDDRKRSHYPHTPMNTGPLTMSFRVAYVDKHNRVGETSEPMTATINP